MAVVASEGAPQARHQLAQRLRAAVLGPHGGETTRRRASDVFRLGFAIVVVAVSIPVMQANSSAELRIVRFMHPPPAAISWLVTSAFWSGAGSPWPGCAAANTCDPQRSLPGSRSPRRRR
jgi:hypothetical protein